MAHAQGQVTAERLTALLAGIGLEISKRQVVRLLTSRLDELIAEDREVLRAGLATARWVTVDDTAARHARRDGVTTQIGDDHFTAFRTGVSKSREAFLSLLRDHRPLVDGPLVAAALRRRDQRGDDRPFFVGQVARIAQLAAVTSSAVLRRPHDGSSSDTRRRRQSGRPCACKTLDGGHQSDTSIPA